MKQIKFSELPETLQNKLYETVPDVDIFDLIECMSEDEFFVQLPENFINIGRDDKRCRSIVLTAHITNRSLTVDGI